MNLISLNIVNNFVASGESAVEQVTIKVCKRMRKTRSSDEEIFFLIRGVEKRKAVLMGTLSASVTAESKTSDM